ncbi:MAG: 4Fe-4S dicluster domain-containing protein [Desulfovibrionaceae bacterium]
MRLDGCPSSIGLDVLARLALTNVQTTIFLHGDCARCEKGDKLRLFHKTLAAFRELCPADADKFQCVRHKTAQLVEKHSVSRRDFFSLFQPRPAPTETVEQSPSTTVSLPASARANLHSALRTLACSGRLPADFPAAELSISASCNGCGACANTCPTEALECVRASSGFRLLFATWKCIDCGLCETVCLSKSISRGPATRESFMAPAPRTLCAGPLQVCKRCDAKVSGLVNGYCQVCARKLGL